MLTLVRIRFLIQLFPLLRIQIQYSKNMRIRIRIPNTVFKYLIVQEGEEYLHWMVGNIRGSDLATGDLLCEYLQPFPPSGTGYHRYAFVLYKQEARIDFAKEKRAQGQPLVFFSFPFTLSVRAEKNEKKIALHFKQFFGAASDGL
jgi:hypothetical protein